MKEGRMGSAIVDVEQFPLIKWPHDVIDHLFLPRQLPGKQLDESLIELETQLLYFFQKFLSKQRLEDYFNLNEESEWKLSVSRQHFHQVQKLFQTWSEVQTDSSPVELTKCLAELQTGNSFAFYVRQQNATVLVTHKGDCDSDGKPRLWLSTFIASQSNESVFKSEGDMVAEFPGVCISIPFSNVLKSEVFAEQLLKFCSVSYQPATKTMTKAGNEMNEERDIPNPMLVTQYLVTALSDHSSAAVGVPTTPTTTVPGDGQFYRRIRKKIRDNITFEKPAGKPFRRSGLWLSMKVVLQLELVNRFGEKPGLLLYKLLILKILSESCSWCLSTSDPTKLALSSDLTQQMISKVARRLAKITTNFGLSINQEDFVSPQNRVIENVGVTLTKVRDRMEEAWRLDIRKNSGLLPRLHLTEAELRSDTIHKLAHSGAYLSGEPRASAGFGLGAVPTPPTRNRFRPMERMDTAELPKKYNFTPTKDETTDEQLLSLTLYDFERYIFSLPSDFLSELNCKDFLDLLKSYSDAGKKFYVQDPVGGSRMVLTCLKIVKLFDVLAVSKHELLASHNSGVNAALVQELLIPTRQQALLVSEMESYFQTRNRNASADLPSLVGESALSTSSFSVRYGDSNESMVSLRTKILEHGNRKCEATRTELSATRKTCDGLKVKARRLEHEWGMRRTRWGRYDNKHLWECKKCALEKEIENCKVDVYEKPLPENEDWQKGIVFELLIPIEIACLRDALFLFTEEVCLGSGSGSSRNNVNVQDLWTTNRMKQTYPHYRNQHQKYISLGSTTVSSLKVANESRRQVDRPDSDFILNNGSNAHLIVVGEKQQNRRVLDFAKSEALTQMPTGVKKSCTFQVQPHSPYSGMQWMLKSTNHNQNEVLASQSHCPSSLSLAEFNEFGSLRVGHRLQYRNVFRAIAHQSLTFSEESVLSLVCQTIWEAGPSSSSGQFYREAHEDIATDFLFVNELLSTLGEFLEKNEKNWNDEYVLLVVLLICQRVLSLSTEGNVEGGRGCRARAKDLVLKCREVSLDWTKAIEGLLSKMASDTNSSSAENSSHDELSEQVKLRRKLVHVAAFGALTFSTEDDDGNDFLIQNLSLWLRFITKIDDNILLTNESHSSLPPMTRNLLRWVRIVGVNLEPVFHARPDVEEVLNKFVVDQWGGASEDELGNWQRYEGNSDQWYSCTCVDRGNNVSILQTDVVLGKFLVNGQPIGRLPSEITSHPDFQRLFGSLVLVVQNAGGSAHITKDEYHGRRYKFQLIKGDQGDEVGELIVTETGTNGGDGVGSCDEFQLVPHKRLKGDIPILLVKGHSQWKHRREKYVQLRPREFLTPGFRTDVKYVLDLAAKTLTETMHGRLMVDINSSLHYNIGRVMRGLENRDYLHLFAEGTTHGVELSIELPRMGLHFFATAGGVIESREHRGFQVRADQGFGTLIGLQQILLLSSENANPIVFIPHGNPTAAIKETDHHSVVINTKSLRKPPCFVLEVDETLRRLKTQPVQCAWLYLAQLHALTSSVLPDPFTGLTGTESAITLLQSPFCWSCEPLDSESLDTLHSIQELSPVRQFYPPGKKVNEMETVLFPSCIPTLCAHDGYTFLVQQLKEDSTRLSFAFGRQNQGSSSAPNERCHRGIGHSGLGKRAYWRSSAAYSPQSRIQPEFDQTFAPGREPKCLTLSSLDLSASHAIETLYDDSNLRATRLVADLGVNWTMPANVNTEILRNNGGVCDTKLVAATIPTRQLLAGGFETWSEMDVVTQWLSLYNFARHVVAEENQASWTLILSASAYTGTEETRLQHLKILHAIALNHDKFQDLNPPPFQVDYTETGERSFDRQVLDTKLQTSAISFGGPTPKDSESPTDYATREQKERKEHESKVEEQIKRILDHLEQNYSQLKENVMFCNIGSIGPFSHLRIDDASGTNEVIKTTLLSWYRNRLLNEFMDQVEQRLRTIFQTHQTPATQSSRQEWFPFDSNVDVQRLRLFGNRQKFNVGRVWWDQLSQHTNVDGAVMSQSILEENLLRGIGEQPQIDGANGRGAAIMEEQYSMEYDPNGIVKCDEILDEYNNDLRTSWNCRPAPATEPRFDFENALLTKVQLQTRGLECWNSVVSVLELGRQSLPMNLLRLAGLLHRITPKTILPLICDHSTPQSLRRKVEQVAISWTLEQKVKRCLRFAAAGPAMALALNRELETFGYENWSPEDRPEWLLLQLEMDLMIRPVQVSVAEQMSKETGHHSLTQLNMGEGKTAVIIPMLAARLANGSQLCRVTVLKSLYNTNKKMLAYSLGGLLNRRLYTFPCRRDMKFDAKNVRTIQTLYGECLGKCGVVMTVPEFRLSFQLKAYDKCESSDEMDTGRELVATNIWLRNTARDILDECDEILNAKYQLIYTIGGQQQVAGGPDRWVICQKLLKIVPQHLQTLLHRTNPGIEMHYFEERDRTWGGFPRCRILDTSCYSDLCQLIAQAILRGHSEIAMPPDLPTSARNVLLKFLTIQGLQRAEFDAALELFQTSAPATSFSNTFLILRGLLAYGVLLHCLVRRWRVNYGVNADGPKKMAVPFRAKDVSSERTEFGHTDVAILFTQLSYYYKGLSADQVRDCFQFLSRYDDKDLQYNAWISDTPVSEEEPSLSTLAGINLADYDQTRRTVRALRKNMRVIDFWLANAVYPKESKQFPHKLTCTPWDLCSDEIQRPVTGFSGTNDAKLLLPLTIIQEDLEELMGTNGTVLDNLLKPENNNYDVFPLGTSGETMLAELVQRKIPLLLDVGALMIDLSNEGVAREWLQLVRGSSDVSNTKYKAAVYFSVTDEIMVLDHEGRKIPFNLSPYRSNLDACLIYLDDVHTRGTDLKIPRGTKGCVTLGKGVTKDKLVQGCMRMRMLGNGHTVAFCASKEVDTEIRTISPTVAARNCVGGKEVLLWAVYNSSVATRDGFQHWINGAGNFYTKSGAHSVYAASALQNSNLKLMARTCREDEVLDLKDLYGTFRKAEQFQIIAKRRLAARSDAFESSLPNGAPAAIMERFEDAATEAVRRCRKYTKTVVRFTSMLDEEQERELEHEQEEEREKERPEPALAAQPYLDPHLQKFVTAERNMPMAMVADRWCVPLPHVLRKIFSQEVDVCQEHCWAADMFATNEFCNVIQPRGSTSCDGKYLRPVTWFISKKVDSKTTVLLLLSPYEANELKNMFKGPAATPGTYLHMFAARLHPDHSTFWKTPALTSPAFISDNHQDGCPIGNHELVLNANLLLFSGSLFFIDEEEENFYCYLLGLVPTPRNETEQRAVSEGFVKNGWLQPDYRTRFMDSLPAATHCKFTFHPAPLANKIIGCRHETLPDSCHVFKLVKESRKTFVGGAAGDRMEEDPEESNDTENRELN